MKYDVTILAGTPFIKKVTNSLTIKTESTAIITFYNKDTSTQKIVEYGYITMDEIQQNFDAEKNIVLDSCYVKNIALGGDIHSLSARDAFFDGKSNFTRAIFSGDTSFSSTIFSGNSSFSSATFSGNSDFKYAIFNGDASFNGVTFSGDISFSSAAFGGNSSFNSAIFNGNSSFSSAIFGGNSSFINTTFNGGNGFHSAAFNGNSSFINATFNKDSIFNSATFSGDANFISTTFSGNVNFSNVKVAEIQNAIFIKNTVFNTHIDMKAITCHSLVISDCIMEKTIDLTDAEINQISLKNTKNLGQIYLDWERSKVKNAIDKYSDIKSETPFYDKALTARLLKENFRNIGQYDDEDKAYVAYRQYEALSNLHGEDDKTSRHLLIGKRKPLKRWLMYGLKWLFLDKMGSYATNPWSILIYININIMFFALLYLLFGIYETKFGCGILSNLLASFYFSAITAFTVGYGDISPPNAVIAILACIEAFFGVFLMSYFTVAFARKVLR